MELVNGFSLRSIRGDIFGGLTAAVVALPLALAFGVASGAGAIAGLYGAIFVGFFAALFGGTPAQVSGPTGPMTVVMAAVVMQYAHDPVLAFTVVMMGGALQIAMGALRLGRYITYVPFSVISGFMSGIGCIIIILQLAPLFGHASSKEGVITALARIGDAIAQPHWSALALGLLTLAIVVFMPGPWRRWLPPPLAALLIGTPIALAFFPDAPVIGAIPRGMPEPILPTLSLEALPGMIKSAVILALLGAIDSLLTSLIADDVTRTQHKSDRELVGQGIGNIVAGLFGSIPGAGATMRTVINVRAGGRTPLSGALHAVVLLALVLGLAPLAEGIPLAVLAGILLKVGWDIIDWDYLRRLRRAPHSGIFVMFTVLLLTVLVDLITAVGVGIIMKSLISARQLSAHQLDQLRVTSSDEYAHLSEEESAILRAANGKVLLLHFSGPFSFCSAKDLVRRLSSTGFDYPVVVYDFGDVPMVDTSVAMAINDVIEMAAEGEHTLIVSGLGGQAAELLARFGALDPVPMENRHRSRLDALRQATASVNGSGPAPLAEPA